MNVLVIGCGRLGARLAALLDKRGHEVSVVDANPDTFAHLPDDFSGQTVNGIPMDMDVLKNAGIENTDAVAVVTADDNLNITISQVAREFFKIENVITRIGDPRRESVFTAFGLHTICPTKMAADTIYQALTSPWEARQVTFGTSTVTFRIWQPGHAYLEKPLEDSPCNPGESVFGVVRVSGKMELIQHTRRQRMQPGDHVIFAAVVD